jgi:hypothetical protein
VSARMIDRNSIGLDQDWEESNAAFTCPVCTKIFIVIALFHQDGGSTQIPCDKSSGSGQARGVMRPWPQGSVTGRPTESHYPSAKIHE